LLKRYALRGRRFSRPATKTSTPSWTDFKSRNNGIEGGSYPIFLCSDNRIRKISIESAPNKPRVIIVGGMKR
jgi:hypothetical protein